MSAVVSRCYQVSMSAVTLVSLVGCIIILVVIIFLMVVICNVMSTKPGKKIEFVKMFLRNDEKIF